MKMSVDIDSDKQERLTSIIRDCFDQKQSDVKEKVTDYGPTLMQDLECYFTKNFEISGKIMLGMVVEILEKFGINERPSVENS